MFTFVKQLFGALLILLVMPGSELPLLGFACLVCEVVVRKASLCVVFFLDSSSVIASILVLLMSPLGVFFFCFLSSSMSSLISDHYSPGGSSSTAGIACMVCPMCCSLGGLTHL